MQIEYPMLPTGEVMVRLLLRRPDGRRVGLLHFRKEKPEAADSPEPVLER